jgi:hypothetical protein
MHAFVSTVSTSKCAQEGSGRKYICVQVLEVNIYACKQERLYALGDSSSDLVLCGHYKWTMPGDALLEHLASK